ncbi:M13 family metallopeptidase [Pendulispora rubella]|uniref:M13 family metallopeptidase n=1 Tax=Pendulispora rubella TaxID=2741070 RepID=A0ABZ2KWH6_9BACT
MPSSIFLRPALALSLLSALSSVACGGAESPPPAQPPSPPTAPAPAPVSAAPPMVPGHSLDLGAMDRSVKPGADIFLYANGAWYAKAEIPADRNATGAGMRVTEEIEGRTRGILEEASKGAAAGPLAKKIGDTYASYMDEAAIEAKGTAPLRPLLDRIAKIRDARSLAAYLGSSLRADVDPLNDTNYHTDHVLGLFVEQDLNDPSRSVPYLLQGGIGMPERSYYLEEGTRMQAHRDAYLKYVATLLRLAGVADADAKAARVVALEKKIAQTHASREDSGDFTKANNPWSRADFASKAPGLDWNAFFVAASLDKHASFIVWQPAAVTGLGALAKSEPISVWKEYLTARTIDHVARFLPKAFVDASFAFHSKQMRGTQAPPPRWRRANEVVTESLGEAVGKLYVERYFPPETKRAVQSLVENLVTAFGRRIDALSWMAPATKAKAKEKLGTLKVEVGYPDTWRDYSGLEVTRGDALGNFERAESFEYRRNLQKIGRPADRGEWAMVPQVVNAVNLPVRNTLNFPAGMLSPPYFNAKSTAAANYGSIGAIIGHEISHSFDDQGAKFDARGRFADWWTPDDLAHFQASAAALAAQYDAYKPFPDLAINGKQTLGENIADLAGLAVAFDAWRASLGGAPAPVQDGLSGEQQFFLSYAQSWQSKLRDESLRNRIKTDGHAPPKYRTFTMRNLDAWYSAFDVGAGDPLYLAPNARVRVW